MLVIQRGGLAMINVNAVNKTSNKQSILPPFAENTDNNGNSFRDILNGVRNDNNFMSSPFNNNPGIFSPNRENNSYSNNYQNQSYSEKNSFSSYNDRFKDNRYDKDRYAYEGVENKSYSENNSFVSKNRKDGNNISNRQVFERRDVKSLGSNPSNSKGSAGFSSGAGQTNSNGSVNNNAKPDNMENNTAPQQEMPVEVSIKDLLLLLQSVAKISDKPSNDENTENGLKEETSLKPESIVETIAAKLHIDNNLKAEFKDILNSIQDLSKEDIDKMLNAIQTSIKNMEELGIDMADELSLMKISQIILASMNDAPSLNDAYSELKDKIASFEKNIIKNGLEDSSAGNSSVDGLEDIDNILSGKPVKPQNNGNKDEHHVDTNTVDKATELLNNVVALIEKAVDNGKPLDKEQITLAKEILESVKTILENKNTKPQDASKVNELASNLEKLGSNAEAGTENNQNIEKNASSILKDINNIQNSIKNNQQQNINNNTETAKVDFKNNIENIIEPSVEKESETALQKDQSENSKDSKSVKNELTDKVKVLETASNNKETVNTKDNMKDTAENAKDLKQSSHEEAVEESKTDSSKVSEKTTKDTAKQSETVSTKDIQKEFKTSNTDAENSLRNQAQAKADAKANTVNLSDLNKGLSNQSQSKQPFSPVNSQGENFSTIQNDKGNNFNQLLKAGADAQIKNENMQSKETQAPYNMKEPRDIERLVRTMQSSVHKGESKLTVVLTPENLGRLQIHLSESGGKITAKFMAENESSHKLIMSQSELLKNQLSDKGIVIDNMEFAFNDTMNKGQNNDEHGRKANRQSQKGKNFKGQSDDLEVGTEVANNKSSGIYA